MPYFDGVFKLSRNKRRASQQLGNISPAYNDKKKSNRRDDLDKVDKYLKSCQYDNHVAWDATDGAGNPFPIRKRKPLIIYNLPKRIQDTVGSKLLGPRVFPSLNIAQDPLTEELLKLLINQANMKAKMLDVARYLPSHGSAFARFKLTNGFPMLEIYNPNYCYPEFDDTGELEKLEIKYVFDDLEDKDEKGNPKKKWYRLELGKEKDILYNNPECKEGSEPEFKVSATAQHNLGFVQGEWFKIGTDIHKPDGCSLIYENLDFFDAFNYSLSQTDQAVKYNQEPQLILKGMDTDEMENLIKSSMSSWNLGRDGDASYLETSMSGVQVASEQRMNYRQLVADITRVVMLDPEKIVGSAQSAKAMEVMHGPLLDLIDEYRPYVEKSMMKLMQKMIATVLLMAKQGMQFNGFQIPQNYKVQSLDIVFTWPPVFPMTMADLQQKVSTAAQASQANLISRRTATTWLAKEFGIEDIEQEILEVNNQPQLGGFGFF
jgi:hypothetical protein